MTTNNRGTGSGKPSGTRDDAGAAALAELVARLQAHSESLRRDIRRLQRALSEINGAMALSLDRVERLRSNTDRLRAIFGTEAADAAAHKPERRSGMDRRSGLDRRREASEVAGLMRWIEGTSLDRRKGADRRAINDRRQTAAAKAADGRARSPSVQPRPGGDEEGTRVVSLAAYRQSRKAAAKPSS